MDGSVWVQQQPQRERSGRFALDVSGNPTGKRKGTLNRMTRLKAAVSVDEGGAVARAVIDRALAGDRVALRLCFAAILPKARARPVEIDLPACDTVEGVVAAFAVTVAAMAAGEITPDEALKVTRVLERKGRVLAAREVRGAAEAVAPAVERDGGGLHSACKNRDAAEPSAAEEVPVAAPREPLPTFGSACIRPVITGRRVRRAGVGELGAPTPDHLHFACNYRSDGMVGRISGAQSAGDGGAAAAMADDAPLIRPTPCIAPANTGGIVHCGD